MQHGTIIAYMYRDASNYKFDGSFSVAGTLSVEDLRPYLFDQFWFVPERVGVSSLVPSPTNEDDHLLHEFLETKPGRADDAICTASEFADRVKRAHLAGWF